ncbi:MAG: Zn-ribbon domain-containing OB-fold protein [Gammaproteobacteria bacterium]|nr:Zn-ribbon domain-containing OB-fold protein [Gammaproteobacteria bacterium]
MAESPLPVVEYLKLSESGEPFLEGHRCQQCGAVFIGSRDHCSKCGARDSMETFRLSNTGRLYAYSIVHRSFPGIDVPYVSAIVDVDGGGTLKGNLIDVEPDPGAIEFDMPVEIVFGDALGRKDGEGNSYVAFFFRPVNGSH